jgi:saccharopine dehydrogenase-like NADP-dependent oxidoreductase
MAARELKVAVLGAGGTIAPAIVRDLAESDEVSGMLLLDIDEERAAQVAERHGGGKAKSKRANARGAPSDHDSVTRAIARCDVLVNSASYRVNLDAMRACVATGTHYLDLGGLYWMTSRQLALSPEFEAAELTGILGIGSSPGKTNLMGARALKELDEVESMHVAAAGRDMEPPAGFSPPYALQTLIDELTLKPVVLRAGKPCEIEPLSDGGRVDFGQPIGEVETIHTLHSELKTFGSSFGARNVSFRLALEPNLLERLRKLSTCSAERIAREQRKVVAPSPKTVSVHLVEAAGGGREVRVRCVTKPSKRWRLGGGIVSTAAPAAAAVRLLARGEVTTHGALPPEKCLDADAMFAELEQRGCEFDVEVGEGVVAT